MRLLTKENVQLSRSDVVTAQGLRLNVYEVRINYVLSRRACATNI